VAVANGSIAEQVKEVHECAMGCLRASSVRHLADRLRPWLANGKMLRARLVLRLGAVTGVPVEDSLRAATAVELIHAASLLHDDVIDEGHLRRGRPAMWVEEGIKSAILLGDLLVCHAMGLAQRCRDASIAGVLVESAQEMCDAETQQ
jgi:geranylgeranyl pyrophosphate synthase